MTLSGCASEPVVWVELPLAERTFFESNRAMQQGQYQVPVAAGDALEYMLQMNANDTIIYQWTTQIVSPEQLIAEFHGHTIREDDEPGIVMVYETQQADHGQGSLAAPFDGIHGWYFNNESDENIVIELQIAGFYELYEEDH